MAEIARMHASSHDQKVVFEFSAANAWASHLDGASRRIDALDLGQQHSDVFLLRLELAKRRGNLGRRQHRGRDLIQKRLEDMVIAPIKQQDVDIGSLQRTRGCNAGKSTANDHNAFPLGSRIGFCRLFLRNGFGQNCAQWCTR